MKVAIVGGGPAGLYLAILLKRADAGNDVTVLERNAPGATFGWGVVFSEETLGALRDADHPTYLEITDGFARWDAIDIRYRGNRLTSRGHAFSAISRRGLLAILQRRCHGLGVSLRFEAEVDDPIGLAEDNDLVVGADGVNSLVRRTYEQAFAPAIAPQGCPYVWFGTDLVLDAFTFIFKATEHGLVQVHAYPYDEHTSTFIVECPEPVWRATGLDRMSEQESIAFCEALFADELQGHRLMSNRSLWTRFQRLRTRAWHTGNVVLVGDAAHTAHFSIGSGTKLAMEDAIVLANAVGAHPRLEDALVAYALERQPVVERFQQAADDSAQYFGRVGRYDDLHPIQFAFNLLTRSGRISHANLMLRDPEFVRVLDAWMAGGGRAAPPPLFSPFTVGGLELPNRIVAEGRPVSGAGLLLTDFVAVSEAGRITPDTPVCHAGATLIGDAPVCLRLGHAGARGAARPRSEGVDLPLLEGGWPLLAASALPYSPGGPVPNAMDGADMARVREEFVAAARAAVDADMLELDFSHGYLLAGFISPLTNRRDDEYGGSLANRLRFPLEVLRAVRAAWAGPLAVRLSVTDWARRGVGVDEGVEVARGMAGQGCDLVHVVAGQTVIDGRPEYRRGFLTALSDQVRSRARVPTLVGGHLTTLDEGNTIVGAARGDLCIIDFPDSELERAALAAGARAEPAATPA